METPSLQTPYIATPDQRLRVFISSTLQELAPEREAAKRAVQELRLTPVMFELGARPHPPRALYRAYLEQSHIFVGIYAQRYGWVAPGEDVSGLEDEYRLSGSRPKLIYVKRSETRDERLKALLATIQADDRVSYKPFSTPRELKRLIEDDLAVLLTERFTQGQVAAAPILRSTLPSPATPLIGREREVEELCELLGRGARLITLSGPGGIGKTRLALEVARRVADAGQDVLYVPLAAVSDPAQVAGTLARALELRSDGTDPAVALESALAQRDLLLVLDNFEQVVAAAPVVSRLLAVAPALRVLVTSRAVLRLVGEYEYPVPPLALPALGRSPLEALQASDAVQLFVFRARAVRPDFELTLENALSVAEICYRLDGLPLAIELAAARVKLFSPKALLARLGDRLSLRSDARDLPERQRTLRGTIDWSYTLLTPEEQRLFALLGLFVGGADLEAVEAVCRDECGLDLLEGLTSLVDKSLLEQQEADDGEPRFVMLETIRAYAAEKLAVLEDAGALRARHTQHYLAVATTAAPLLRTREQTRALARLWWERGNFRAVFERSLAAGDLATVARLGWLLWDFWWVRGYQNEGRAWLDAALAQAEARPEALLPQERARALYVAGTMAFIQGDYAAAEARGRACLALAQSTGDRSSEGLAFLGLGLVALYQGNLTAAAEHFETSLENFRRFGNLWATAHALHYLWRLAAVRGEAMVAERRLEESAELFRKVGDRSALVLVLHNLAMVALLKGDEARADALLREGLAYSRELRNRWYLAYCLEGFASLAATRQDGAGAGTLFGAAAAIRAAINAPQTPADQALYQGFVTAARALAGTDAYQQAVAEGSRAALEPLLAALAAPQTSVGA